MSKIILTGAAGFIGSHTAERLLAEGRHVLGVDNFRTGKRENLQTALQNKNFTFIEEDICRGEAVKKLVGDFKPDAIIHLAALVSVKESVENPDLNFEINLRGAHNIAEAARLCGVRRIVLASSAAIYGNNDQLPLKEDAPPMPASPYGMAKLASEQILLAYSRCYGLQAVCLRYFNVYGPRQDPSSPYSGVISVFHKCSKEGKTPTIFGDGKQTRDFIFVRDVARANTLAATAPGMPGGAYNACTGKQISLLELLATMKKSFPDVPAPRFEPARPGDILHSCGSPEKLRSALNFSTETSLEDGLKELFA